MLGVIVDEKKVIDKLLESEKLTSDINKNLFLMIKYYYILEGVTNKQELKEKVFSLLKDKYDGYKRGKWETAIDRSVSSFLKHAKYKKEDKTSKEKKEFYPNKEFVRIEKIEVTDNELKCISKLNDLNLEKISFIMLVYAKISNKMLRDDTNWVGQSISNILKESKINLKGNDKELLLHKLYNIKLCQNEIINQETGEITIETINYITMTKSNSKNSFKINYLDNENQNNKMEIVIEDFESVIYYYLLWKGEKWKKCECCNKKWFKLKVSNSKQKYCSICAKKEKTKKTIENRQKLKM